MTKRFHAIYADQFLILIPIGHIKHTVFGLAKATCIFCYHDLKVVAIDLR